MITVALIGCSDRKLQRPAPARELYTSVLFRKSLAYAETLTPHAFVISAQHGLVDLDRVLAPYDLALHQLTNEEIGWWGLTVTNALHQRFRCAQLRIVVLAGALYVAGLQAYQRDYPMWEFEAPMAGMEIGQRLQWLTRAVPAGASHA